MAKKSLQGWATKISGVADHAYVRCTLKKEEHKYFVCWGTHNGPDKREICKSKATYAVPDCYRGAPILGHKDTAEIGLYVVNGVCHQSANCFLYSASPRVTLNLHVRGYWLTVIFYGTYGTLFLEWIQYAFAPCAKKKAAPKMDALSSKLHALYAHAAETLAQGGTVDMNDLIVRDAAITAEHWVPGIPIADFAELHRGLLTEKDRIIDSGAVGEPLAAKLNMLGRRAQETLAAQFDSDQYERLIGVPPSEALDIIDPAIAHAAGRPRS
jgi:hypothetical protein